VELEPVQSGGVSGLRSRVVASGSAAARAGIQKDDVLLEINRIAGLAG
jgi:S1-C subfamily serine protease